MRWMIFLLALGVVGCGDSDSAGTSNEQADTGQAAGTEPEEDGGADAGQKTAAAPDTVDTQETGGQDASTKPDSEADANAEPDSEADANAEPDSEADADTVSTPDAVSDTDSAEGMDVSVDADTGLGQQDATQDIDGGEDSAILTDSSADGDATQDAGPVLNPDPAGDLVWAVSAGGDGANLSRAISVVPQVGLLITGEFRKDALFGQGGPQEVSLSSSGDRDLFLARYDLTGELSWAVRAGGEFHEWGDGVQMLSDGSSVITGGYAEAAVFGEGEPEQASLLSAGAADYFVARYDPEGSLIWAVDGGGDGAEMGRALAVLADGSSLVTGSFETAATFGPGESNETELLSSGQDDAFLARFGNDGALKWATRAGGPGSDYGNAVAALEDGSSFVTGVVQEAPTFAEGEENEIQLDVSFTLGVFFLARYDADGQLVWVTQTHGDFSSCEGVDVLADGTSFVTGTISGSVTFGLGEPAETTLDESGGRIFVARYDPDGALEWARQDGGSYLGSGNDISVLADGTSFVIGNHWKEGVFGAGEPTQTQVEGAGSGDVFIARYSPEGAFEWVELSGGTKKDLGLGIAALDDGTTFATGGFSGSAIFGLQEDAETTLNAITGTDIFVARFLP